MRPISRAAALGAAVACAVGLACGTRDARAQGVRYGTYATPAPAPVVTTPNGGWYGYAAERAAPWYAYTAQPSPWTGYRYLAPSSPLARARVPSQASDLVPRHLAYGYYYSPRYQNWAHPGYGGAIRNYGHGGRPTELPRPWLWWGSQNL
jgi:hypothetical protein